MVQAALIRINVLSLIENYSDMLRFILPQLEGFQFDNIIATCISSANNFVHTVFAKARLIYSMHSLLWEQFRCLELC